MLTDLTGYIMNYTIRYTDKPKSSSAICFLEDKVAQPTLNLTANLLKALNKKPKKWQNIISLADDKGVYVRVPTPESGKNRAEAYRKLGSEVWSVLKSNGVSHLHIASGEGADVVFFAEGLLLKDYRFEPYKSEKDTFSISEISLAKGIADAGALDELRARVKGICFARDLVNEPANILTATELAKRISAAGKDAGFKVDVFDKSKIQALKLSGLLAVNRGSAEKPTFTVMDYSPKGAKNKKPVVLVGKGIVYDTGGLSLKPTANSMDMMKCDMGGAAAISGAIYAIALAKLPIRVVGLVPATDNQPGPNAYQPGDVIEMHNGTRVEVMNTDAEGRLVLADALSYAKKYDPELAIDFATLTGSSVRALGNYAGATMGTADEKTKKSLLEAGFNSWERVVEFPLWDDYETDLKSDIADVRNLGPSPMADVIIAGKFLQRFTDYPWMHVDIAGPAFLPGERSYLPKGGTGFGVNLLFHFLNSRYK